MVQFDGSPINEQDTVYVVGMGPGRVLDVKASGFRIRVAGRTRKVNLNGVQSGEVFQSVYWQDPVTVRPSKNNALWRQQRLLSLATMNALAEAVVGQELVTEIEPAEVDTAESNNLALSEMIQQAQDNEAARVAGTAGPNLRSV